MILNVVLPHLMNLHVNLYVGEDRLRARNNGGSISIATELSDQINERIAAEYGCLTKREIEVASMICRGLGTKTISANLVISPRTIHKHLENIFLKLEVTNRQELMGKIFQQIKI